MAAGSSGSRNSKQKSAMRSPQTSTRLASKRQAKLPFKKQRGPGDYVRRADFDPSKLMYRSNISGLISTVKCAKLVGTLTECHNLKLAAATIEPKECGRIIIDLDPPEVCNERRTVSETVDVGSIEPSFNCWQADTKTDGNMKIEGGNDYDNKNTGTPTSKEKVAGKIASRGEVWPILFPDLLELSSTPDGEGVGQEQGGTTDELVACKVRIADLESEISIKDVRICDLEKRVETLEKLLGQHAGNLFADINNVIINKDSEIAWLSKQVDQLEAKIGNLEDSLDDLELNNMGWWTQWNTSAFHGHERSGAAELNPRQLSGRAEYVGTSYIYTSVCSDVMRNSSAVSRAKYLNKQWVSDHHSQFVKPIIIASGVGADLFDGSFVSVVDCPQQLPESSDCGIFVCFIIRQYIRGAEVNTMMDGLTSTGLRAAMVDMFLSDPGRGLRGRTL
ncbi:hypothetical protein LOK49_LG04G02496 [Camellia lanceoleosa]|uniref:Uncharacterized protein n=1 Tax=Camellia lanceoleosa TaxID=1840588 RepID=A0ACC0I5E5_9ERIC|nr:hypothetical protein LOK49_LG04G02496 [Camellia lanceoleosa]